MHQRPTGSTPTATLCPHKTLFRSPRHNTQEVLPMPETVTAAAQDLRGLAVAALTAAGAQPRHAEWTADILVEGDLMGLGTHGVLRLLLYCERLRLEIGSASWRERVCKYV